jgi:hypothetical protein
VNRYKIDFAAGLQNETQDLFGVLAPAVPEPGIPTLCAVGGALALVYSRWTYRKRSVDADASPTPVA